METSIVREYSKDKFPQGKGGIIKGALGKKGEIGVLVRPMELRLLFTVTRPGVFLIPTWNFHYLNFFYFFFYLKRLIKIF